MSHDHALADRGRVAYVVRPTFLSTILASLLAFPIACFTLTVLTDLSYVQTLNLQWLHFSEWLLLAGLVFGVPALIVAIAGILLGRSYWGWAAVGLGFVVLLLATLNSFIHTADGWTAIMPWGLAVSVLTVLAMLVTAWLSRKGVHHV